MVNADPARTPTLAEFAKPDYYLVRDALALRIEAELEAAAFEDQPAAAAGPQTLACQAIINSAALLARSV